MSDPAATLEEGQDKTGHLVMGTHGICHCVDPYRIGHRDKGCSMQTLSVSSARRSSGLRRWYAFTWLSMRSRCLSAPPWGAPPLAAAVFFALLRLYTTQY